MKKHYTVIAGTLLLLFMAGGVFAQQPLINNAQKKQLNALRVRLNSQYLSTRQKALTFARTHHWPLFRKTKDGAVMSLQGVNKRGFPVYVVTYENIIAAATTGTNAVQPGGVLGLNLSGASPGLNNRLAIWDGGSVYKAHQEFAGKTITNHDTAQVTDHATHVAGTMIAKGVYSPVKGMAFNAATLHSYFFDNDIAEMSGTAGTLLLSNHSYGDEAGWYLDVAENRWEWFGLPGDTVDYNFGFYGEQTQAYDMIAYNAPYYLIVKAAGNFRNVNGPPVGADYYGYQSNTNPTMVDKGARPANLSSNNGFDIITTAGNAKNILTVGAINPLPGGPSKSQDIVIAPFSSWGPTDDGRVKPDIVGDGVNVLSTGSAATNNYITLSGTSMAAPNVTGSLYLLQEYYAQKNGGKFMRAATLKGLACHTAFDAGNTGPDYIYGWGLLDTKSAAQAITDNGTNSLVKENVLNQGQKQTFPVTASGNGPLIATICWTDPAGSPTPEGTINSRAPKLVNDLDVRISDGTNTFYPWVLDPANPSAAAKNGDNIVDNVEQVLIPSPVIGHTYTVSVLHKGALQSGSQDYSLIVTGIGNSTYCASGALSNADSRINNVTLSNVNNTPPAGCTSYSNYTNMTIQLQQGKTYPLSITLGTCGANFNKAAKVYIDWNDDKIFEPNELVATTDIIGATGTYQTTISVPVSVVPGSFSLMRVVAEETDNPSAIQPCGSYAKGETQDYRVQFTANTPVMTTGSLTGSISACAGTPSASPNIQKFTVSAQNLTGNITAAAPAGFEISLTAGGGFSGSLALSPVSGSVGSTTIYVRSSANAPTGNISGDVVLTTPGAIQDVTVTGYIDPLPIISPLPNQGPVPNGATIPGIKFTGTGHAYSWVNDTPGIGLAANGTDSIPSFTAINNGNGPITAKITVTPVPSPAMAYVPNAGNNNVSVINTVTKQIVTKIPVGASPMDVSVNQNGSLVYVVNEQAGTVSVIDAASNSVLTSVPFGASLGGIVVSPDDSKVYVCNGTFISVLNTASNTISTNIPMVDYATDAAISPDGNLLYVVTTGDSLKVINTITNKEISSVYVNKSGWPPLAVAVNPGGSGIYVANTFDNNIAVYNTAGTSVLATIPLQVGPIGMCFNTDGSRLYVSESGDNSSGILGPGTVSVVNTATNALVATIPVGVYPIGISITPDDSEVYVANDAGAGNQGSVSVISTVSNKVTNTINLGVNPLALGNFISPGTRCTGTPMTFTITVNPTPVITVGPATGSMSACFGSASASPDIQQFTVSGNNLSGNITVTAPTGFEVSLVADSGYGNSLVIAPSSGGTANNTVVYVRLSATAVTGTLSAGVVISAAGVANKYVTVAGTVSAALSPSVAIAISSNTICAGSTATFTAQPVNGGSATVYQWAVNGNNAGTNSAVFASSTLADGDVISCAMISSATCAAPANAESNSIKVHVLPSGTAPTISISASATTICSGSPVTFTAVTSSAGPVYQWMVNGGNAGTNSPEFTSSDLANSDTISCQLTTSAGCYAPGISNSITMIVNPTPTVNAGGDKTIKENGGIILNATASGNVTDITWSPSAGLNNNKILNPLASPSSTTKYTLLVQTADGCTATDNATITVLVPIVIPNAFTPNGDGINDKWDIDYLDTYQKCIVQIFTRSGQKIYSSIGYGNPWDGTYKGTALPAGTYYYIIDLNDGSKLMAGYVALLR